MLICYYGYSSGGAYHFLIVSVKYNTSQYKSIRLASMRTNNQHRGFAEMQSLLLCPQTNENVLQSRP